MNNSEKRHTNTLLSRLKTVFMCLLCLKKNNIKRWREITQGQELQTENGKCANYFILIKCIRSCMTNADSKRKFERQDRKHKQQSLTNLAPS